MLGTAFTYMHMGTILIVISIPKKELPDDLSCDIEQYFRHRYYKMFLFTPQR